MSIIPPSIQVPTYSSFLDFSIVLLLKNKYVLQKNIFKHTVETYYLCYMFYHYIKNIFLLIRIHSTFLWWSQDEVFIEIF